MCSLSVKYIGAAWGAFLQVLGTVLMAVFEAEQQAVLLCLHVHTAQATARYGPCVSFRGSFCLVLSMLPLAEQQA